MSKNINILRENETLDDLQRDDLFVIQSRNHYRFSIDSVLLSDFVKTGHDDNCVELCSGCGVISILVHAKCHPRHILGVELDEALHDMSTRSLEYNGIEDISFIREDLKELKSSVKEGSVDVVFSNPPYLLPLKDMSRVSSRFHHTKYETTTSLEDILSVTAFALKCEGRFCVIYCSMRLQELLSKASNHHLFLSKIQFVYFKEGVDSALVMCEFVKNKEISVSVLPPIIF